MSQRAFMAGLFVGMASIGVLCITLMENTTKPHIAKIANSMQIVNRKLPQPRITMDTRTRLWLWNPETKTSSELSSSELFKIEERQ